jgi:hypothetical protein
MTTPETESRSAGSSLPPAFNKHLPAASQAFRTGWSPLVHCFFLSIELLLF